MTDREEEESSSPHADREEVGGEGRGPSGAHREYARVLRMQARLLLGLERIREDLEDPRAHNLFREIARQTGEGIPDEWSDALAYVEEAIRSLKIYGAKVGSELIDETPPPTVEGIPNLPPSIARFLAERQRTPGFECDVRSDPERGWVITWREFTSVGELRAFGQLPERPWAWISE